MERGREREREREREGERERGRERERERERENSLLDGWGQNEGDCAPPPPTTTTYLHSVLYRDTGLSKTLYTPDDYSTKTRRNILNSFSHLP
jgi:hypothetical protein